MLEPTTEAGGVTPPAAPPPAQQQTLPIGQPPAAPQTVPVPLDQLQQLLAMPGRLAEYETRWQQMERDGKAALVAEQVKRGEIEAALQTVRDQASKDLETERSAKLAEQSRARSFARNAELNAALAGIPFVSQSAAKQFAGLISAQFEAHPDGEGFTVRTATFESPAQVVARLMKDPEYAHFFAASTTGGTGSTGGGRTTPTPQVAGNPPANLGEAVVANWAQQHAGNGTSPLGLRGRR